MKLVLAAVALAALAWVLFLAEGEAPRERVVLAPRAAQRAAAPVVVAPAPLAVAASTEAPTAPAPVGRPAVDVPRPTMAGSTGPAIQIDAPARAPRIPTASTEEKRRPPT